MWAIGRYEIARFPATSCQFAPLQAASTAAQTLAWLIGTALAGPVVPDVKMTVARLSGSPLRGELGQVDRP